MIENNLPIEQHHKNPQLGKTSPIRVVNVVFTSGDSNKGVQTAAFNLPNDENVIKEVGSKKVMLKNVQEAKFNQVLLPIAEVVLDSSQVSEVSFHSFFTHILAHELSHGIGPHKIKVGDRETAVRKELKEVYSAIEEAKADITGLFMLQYLMDKNILDRKLEKDLYTTFLASAFRTLRFGITEAHAKGMAMQFNFLIEKGGFAYNEKTQKFSVNREKIKPAMESLTHELLTLEAEGAYEKAKAFLNQYGVLTPVMEQALGRLKSVPVDIEPRFPLAQ